MRDGFKPCAVTLVATLCLGLSGCSEDEIPSTPNAGINVLLVTVDTLRADHSSTYGYPRATSPALDALAASGVVFETAFTYWPKTRSSFAAIFTSLYASQHGLTVRDRDLPLFNTTLAEQLKTAGYQTAAAIDNANLNASFGFDQGFDTYAQTWLDEGSELERTETITTFGEDFIRDADSAQPFFLWLHYVNPHTPYDPPSELLDVFRGDGVIPRGPELETVVGYHGGVNRKLAIPGETHWGDYVDRYDAEILLADQQLGRVLAALEASGLRERTLVIFTSDHGEALGEHNYFFDHGFDLYNPSLHIPLVLSFPGVLPSGERVRGAVSTLDIYPTVLDLAQVSFPPELEGSSVIPLLRGTKDKLHDRLFFQNDQHLLAATNGRLKLISNPDSDGSFFYELYDMYRDPAEEDNRYPSSAAQVAPFRAQLESFRTQTAAWQQQTTARRLGMDQEPANTELSESACKQLATLGYADAACEAYFKDKPDP